MRWSSWPLCSSCCCRSMSVSASCALLHAWVSDSSGDRTSAETDCTTEEAKRSIAAEGGGSREERGRKEWSRMESEPHIARSAEVDTLHPFLSVSWPAAPLACAAPPDGGAWQAASAGNEADAERR